MKCEDCKYLKVNTCTIKGKIIHTKVCSVTHYVNPTSCDIISYQEIEQSNICFNCKHWIGGGDFGLSCKKDYYLLESNGFRTACEKYERK